jgi:hypothetical protein
MKNIHVLPTDKPSRLHTYKGVLNLAADEFVAPTIVKNDLINLNMYITNDEEIKEGDWYLNIEEKNGIKNPFYEKLYKANYSIKSVNTDYRHNLKKIILTTDQELIKDGVQAIDDEFLKWFVKNPSCESVEIDSKLIVKQTKPLIQHQGNKLIVVPHKIKYKIIIPKKEPKQENCCTPVGQIKRYVDCVGCDRKPKQMSRQTVVEWLFNKMLTEKHTISEWNDICEEAKEMEKEQHQETWFDSTAQFDNSAEMTYKKLFEEYKLPTSKSLFIGMPKR